MRTAISLGGDTNTLACIAGAMAEAWHGVPGVFTMRARGYLTADLLDVLDQFNAVLSSR